MPFVGRQPPRESFHREILVSLWKIHILHHAAEHPVVGQWMLEELRHHGYTVSPGTLYPVLKRMEAHGWLRSEADASAGPRARRGYTLTAAGRRVLDVVSGFLSELTGEMHESPGRRPGAAVRRQDAAARRRTRS